MVSLENLEELWGTKHSSSSARASCHRTDGGLRINAPRIGMGHSTEAQQTCAPQRKKRKDYFLDKSRRGGLKPTPALTKNVSHLD